MHHRQLNSEWSKVEERFQQKLSCWKAKYLSYGGRLVLLNAVLSSLPMFMMSFFEIPKGVLKTLDYFRSRFFWQGSNKKIQVQACQMGHLVPAQGSGWPQDLGFTASKQMPFG
jgi:hypothetical protein